MTKATPKTIIVGLGNPGAEYEYTYHNAGWLAIDAWMARTTKATLKHYKKLLDFAETDDAVFIKPLTYMNESGKAVREALKQFGGKPENLIVIHDDSDLTIGAYKVSYARGAGGHKGVQSIIDALKTNAFRRVRIGIRPAREAKRQKAGEFALKTITPAHRKILAGLFAGIIERHLERIRPAVVLETRRR
jgi:peptidyl-tRNA hydrolase, PTH1 family